MSSGALKPPHPSDHRRRGLPDRHDTAARPARSSPRSATPARAAPTGVPPTAAPTAKVTGAPVSAPRGLAAVIDGSTSTNATTFSAAFKVGTTVPPGATLVAATTNKPTMTFSGLGDPRRRRRRGRR